MSDKILLKDGLRIGKKELTLLQTYGTANLLSAITALAVTPSVLTTKTAAGVLGSELQVTPTTGGVSINAGMALMANGALVNLTASTTLSTGTGSGTVVLSSTPSSVEPGTVALSSDRITLTFTIPGGVSADDLFDSNDYVRLINGGTSLGTYRVGSVSSNTVVLADAVPGSGSLSSLNFTQAGKFFPGYPLSGTTTDIVSHDAASVRLAVAGYTPSTNEIVLASYTSSSGTATVTDTRVPLAPSSRAFIITDANVSSTAAIAESKIALSSGLSNAKSWAHQQNTDTYTTATTFRLGGASGKRVLTTDDLATTTNTPPPTGNDTMTLLSELCGRTTFTRPNDTPMLTVTFGVHGGGATVAPSGGNQVVTFPTPTSGETVSANQAVGYALYDSAGKAFKVLSNTSSSGTLTFTVPSTDVTGATTAVTPGTVVVHSIAASYKYEIWTSSNGTPVDLKYETTSLNDSNGLPLTVKDLQFTGTPGATYYIKLIGKYASQAVTTNIGEVTWGAASTGSSIYVDATKITATATSSTVHFEWASSAVVGSYDSRVMDFAVAVQIGDGTTWTPTQELFNQTAMEVPDGGGYGAGGYVDVACGPLQTVKITVKCIDSAGKALSNAPYASKTVTSAANSGGAVHRLEFPFSVTGSQLQNPYVFWDGTLPLHDLTTGGKTILGSYKVTGIDIDLTTYNVASDQAQVKFAVYPVGLFGNAVYSGIVAAIPNQSSYSSQLTKVNSTQFSGKMQVAIENANPSGGSPAAITTVAGTIVVFYVSAEDL